MSRFARAARRLRKLGVIPNVGVIGGGHATYLTVNGYTLRHLAMAFVAGIVIASGGWGIVLNQTDRWIADRTDRKVVAAVASSGVNVELMSTAEIAARLAYSPQIAQALTGDIFEQGVGFVDQLASWLRSITVEKRRTTQQLVLDLSTSIGASQAKADIARGLLALDEITAKALGEPANISAFLRKLGALPRSHQHLLLEKGFPLAPVDDVRAHLWSIINRADFSATDIVEPLELFAKAHPERIASVRSFVLRGGPMPTCKAGPCISHRTDYACPTGSFLAEQLTCSPYAR